MVTGTLPVEFKVRGSVEAIFVTTLPNAKVLVLMLSAGTAAFN
jgi:hypothetical protein